MKVRLKAHGNIYIYCFVYLCFLERFQQVRALMDLFTDKNECAKKIEVVF